MAIWQSRWYWKDKNTGLIRQGGTKVIPFNNQNAANVNISFPKIFPNKVLSMVANEKGNNITTSGMFNVSITTSNTTTATIQAVVLNLIDRTGNVTVYWEATGY